MAGKLLRKDWEDRQSYKTKLGAPMNICYIKMEVNRKSCEANHINTWRALNRKIATLGRAGKLPKFYFHSGSENSSTR